MGKASEKQAVMEVNVALNRERQSDRLCLTVTSRTFSWPSHKADSTASLTCNFWRLCCCVCSPQGLLFVSDHHLVWDNLYASWLTDTTLNLADSRPVTLPMDDNDDLNFCMQKRSFTYLMLLIMSLARYI